MEPRHLGTLATSDPLHDVLVGVFSGLRGANGSGVLEVEQLTSLAYRYRDPATDAAVVVKFFGNRARDRERQVRALHAEFGNLERLHQLGFDRWPHRVVRPLALAPGVNVALVLEWVAGRDLLTMIREDPEERLLAGVEAVGGFLAALHERTRTGGRAEQGPALAYLHKLLTQLVDRGVLEPGEHTDLLRLGEAWQHSGVLSDASEVLIHGDATPRHFLFPVDQNPLDVTVIDLERLGPGDPVADVGRLAAELKHLLLERTGDPQASEPAIRRLYAAYTRRAGIPPEEFAGVTERGRFYMGRDLLRIARNGWIDRGQRRRLIPEALACLGR
ncbi:MAG: aminoglycoside phosphotransferase family protein [Mycobacterium leprae]